MKYFLDTEFHEYKSNPLMGRSVYTIDLISIGIVGEDGKEYYAISKDFNLKEAWNRYDLVKKKRFQTDYSEYTEKVYWIRENVLKPIWKELINWDEGIYKENGDYFFGKSKGVPIKGGFTYNNLKKLINKYGKSNKQIAEEISHFTNGIYTKDANGIGTGLIKDNNPQFYGYYSDYDWVVFCWLFGRMIDLPEGFPMYCIDLKQTMDNFIVGNQDILKDYDEDLSTNKFYKSEDMKSHPDYPKNDNEHNALADAKWNLELYKFLLKL